MRRIPTLVLCMAAFGFAAATHAQSYPNRPIRIIVPNTPGGATDTFARVMGEKLGDALKQPVVVENRGGAQGNIGTAYGAKAAPDGYTLTVAFTSAFALNPFMYPNPGFDPLKDFTAVGLGVTFPLVAVTGHSASFNTLKELEKLAKQEPNSLSYASTSSQTEMMAVLFQMQTRTEMLYVPYKGATTAIIDLERGEVDLMFASIPSVTSFISAGRLKALAVSGDKRVEALPDVMTAKEAGYPDFNITGWYGLVAPAGTPNDIVQKLNAEINKIVAMPDVQKTFNNSGLEATGATVDEFSALIRKDYQRWGEVVEASKKMKK